LLDEFSAWLLTARGRSRATVESYRRDLTQFAELGAVSALADFDTAAVLRWNEALKAKEQKSSSRARKLSALRAFVSWAQEYHHISGSPIPQELTLPKGFYLPYALSEAEVRRIIEAAGGADTLVCQTTETQTGVSAPPVSTALQHSLQLRDHAIVEVLYASGMRVSELTGLRLVDLHLAEGFAIVTGKGSKQRLVPLGQYAIEALRAYLNSGREALCKSAQQHGEVFLSQRGPLSRSQVFRMIKAAAAAAGITTKVSPHTFRHSCASHMLAHGADLRLVQELLGHSALSTTQVYTHIEKSQLRKVYDQTHPLA
jgi:integrase/recombinase XerD